MMDIILNGKPLSLEGGITVETLLTARGYDGKLVAVAVNGEFLPKAEYQKFIVSHNNEIEIVAPMQGG